MNYLSPWGREQKLNIIPTTINVMSVWRHVRAIISLPVVFMILLPAFIVSATGSVEPLWGAEPPMSLLLAAASAGLTLLGAWLMAATITLFSRKGAGTLAPWDETSLLVVEGPYSRVRNPMLSGVFSVLLAEAILAGSWQLMVYTVLFVAVNMVYVPLSEEPGLEARFGEEYRVYKRNVPRWLPRAAPWRREEA